MLVGCGTGYNAQKDWQSWPTQMSLFLQTFTGLCWLFFITSFHLQTEYACDEKWRMLIQAERDTGTGCISITSSTAPHSRTGRRVGMVMQTLPRAAPRRPEPEQERECANAFLRSLKVPCSSFFPLSPSCYSNFHCWFLSPGLQRIIWASARPAEVR